MYVFTTAQTVQAAQPMHSNGHGNLGDLQPQGHFQGEFVETREDYVYTGETIMYRYLYWIGYIHRHSKICGRYLVILLH